MLEQAKQFEQEDAELDGETKILQVVADVARLPFQSGTIAGIHSGKCCIKLTRELLK